jgi:hypothetical protein
VADFGPNPPTGAIAPHFSLNAGEHTVEVINSSGLFADERIRPPFSAELRGRSVTGKNGHAIAQRKKLFANSAEQEIGITAGKVPSADAASEKNIAAN